MASPLAAFRKYQKVLLAVFGVALMLVFTVGGLVSQYLGASPQGPSDNPVVVSWKDGQILESEMQMHRYARNQLRQFQFAVMQEAMSRGGSQELMRHAIVPIPTVKPAWCNRCCLRARPKNWAWSSATRRCCCT